MRSKTLELPALFCAGLLLTALLHVTPALANTDSRKFETRHHTIIVEKVAGSLNHPWGLAFLPNGDMLVTERSGKLILLDTENRRKHQVSGVPKIAAGGQGGLLDIVADPDFRSNRTVYFSYSEPGNSTNKGTAVARARLDTDSNKPTLSGVEVLFRQKPKVRGGRHFGSRIVVSGDGTLFVTLGERGMREKAQDLSTHLGKVIRINKDGSIPGDNPFRNKAGALPEIYSYGHRNPQGATLNPKTGRLWTLSHGARGGDEINRPEAAKNYGWPVISYGRHYSGGKIGVGTEAPGMEQPVHFWDPSIAPSGLTFYSGALFPKWRGNLFAGALKSQLISRLDVADGSVRGEEQILSGEYGRIRDIREGPDGALWFLSDRKRGGLFRIVPAP